MRLFLVSLVGLLICAGGLSAAAEDPAAEVQQPRTGLPAPHSVGTEAKVALDVSSGMPIIQVSVNGKGPFKFAVDTGAGGQVHIDPDLATELGLNKIGEARVADGSGLNAKTVPLFAIDKFAIGTVSFDGLIGAATGTNGKALDGVIGMALVQEFLLTIDYAHKSLTLDKSELPAADGKRVLDYAPGRVIVIPVKIGTVVIPTHLDTGNARFPFIVAADLVSGLPTSGTAKAIGDARTVSNVVQMFSVGVSAPVQVGDVTLPIKEIGYPTVAPGGNLGSRGLTGLILRVDQKNHRVSIAPP
jgi:predicted aspartyl protease